MSHPGDKNAEIGKFLFDQGRYSKAIPYFKEALTQNPQNGLLLNYLATCQFNCYADNSIALATIDLAIQADPHDANHFATKAQILNFGSWANYVTYDKKLFVDVDRAIELDPQLARAYVIKAEIFARCHKYDQAILNIKQALELYPHSSYYQSCLSRYLRFQNKRQSSEETTTLGLKNNPNESDLHVNLAWLKLGNKEYRAAGQLFESALKLNPFDPGAKMGLVEVIKLNVPLYQRMSSYYYWFGSLKQFKFYRIFFIVLLWGLTILACFKEPVPIWRAMPAVLLFGLSFLTVLMDQFTTYLCWKSGAFPEGILNINDKYRTIFFLDLFVLFILTLGVQIFCDFQIVFGLWGIMILPIVMHPTGAAAYPQLSRENKIKYWGGMMMSIGIALFCIYTLNWNRLEDGHTLAGIGALLYSIFIISVLVGFIDFLNQKHYLRPSIFSIV